MEGPSISSILDRHQSLQGRVPIVDRQTVNRGQAAEREMKNHRRWPASSDETGLRQLARGPQEVDVETMDDMRLE